MNLGKQTASVVSSPLRKIELVKDYELNNDSIGLLGCLNPESHNQKEMFYCSPTTYKIRLIDNDTTKLPPALSNPQYPNPYEMIFRDRGSDNNNPPDWVKLNKIYGRQALNIKEGTPWKVTWDFDGSYGIQTATIQGLSFTREAAIDDSGRIQSFTHWKMQSNFYYGAIRVTFSSRPNNVANNMLGWASSSFMEGQGVDEQTYPEAFKSMKTGINNQLFPFLSINDAGGRRSIRIKNIDSRYFGAQSQNVGDFSDARLPNIKGGVNGPNGSSIFSYGRFSFLTVNNRQEWSFNPWGNQHIPAYSLNMNASLSSSIYKDGYNTVTPLTAWVDIECFVGY